MEVKSMDSTKSLGESNDGRIYCERMEDVKNGKNCSGRTI
jgi:hypothetical protein